MKWKFVWFRLLVEENMDMISKDALPLNHHLLLYALFLLFFSPTGISKIILGSNISSDGSSIWQSPNTNFAFGIFSPSGHPNQCIAGIRFNFNTIPTSQQTVVWSAGAGATVSCGSYFTLTESGEFVLFDSQRGAVVWTSKTSNLSVVSAALEDSGNLVLLDRRNSMVWQSFDNPSDVLLPGQSLNSHLSLRAASMNSVSSYYTLSVNSLGQLALNWEVYFTYWTSGSSSHPNPSAVLSSDGVFLLVDEGGNPVWSVCADDHNESAFRFLRLDVDGNLRLYSLVGSMGKWKSVWQAISDQCDVFATCGLSGVCEFGDSASPVCRCPFMIDSSGTCLVPNQKMCIQGLPLTKFENTFLYAIYPPNDTFVFSNLRNCRNMCINDTECTAVTYMNDGTGKCLLMRTRYITGYVRPSIRALSYVKLCADPIAVLPNLSITAPPHSFSERKPFRECVLCQIGAASGEFAVFLFVQLVIVLLIYKKGVSSSKEVSLFSVSCRSKGLVAFSFEEVREATQNFKKEVGDEIFEGNLSNNQAVLTVKLNDSIEERKFRNGVLKLGSIHHRSLLRLEGYCCVSGSRLLVFESAKNGSLGNFLKDPKLIKKLTWKKRIDICLSVARGVSYLHHGCREFFSHGKLSYDNVFIDENFEAKLLRFGFRLFEEGESSEGNNAENDIEDFGKIVIMLICSQQLGDQEICNWVYREWEAGRGLKLVDKRIEAEVDLEELERTLRIALWCVQANGRMRPSMGEVVKILEGVLTVDPPPPPDPIFRQSSDDDLSCEVELE